MQKLEDKKPKTIKDFFNTKKFPGKRAIYKGAMSNLEIALVADGVKLAEHKLVVIYFTEKWKVLVLIEL
jgi:hypothetical protein